MLLELSHVDAGYSGSRVLRDVSLHVKDGEVVVLVGPNGAGKSTVLRAIAGLAQVTAGELRLQGHSIRGLPTHRLPAAGTAYVPQGRLVFPALTVEENLRMGAFTLRSPRAVAQRLAETFNVYPALAARRAARAGDLSGGQQQLLAIARALMVRPRLLLLDEPSLGLSPKVIGEVFATIRQLRGEGMAMLLVEQNVRAALAVADRGYVLVNGAVAFAGAPRELADPNRLHALFLGTGPSAA